MHSDLQERCATAREHATAPTFPREAIRNAAQQPEPRRRKRWMAPAVIAGLSAITIAAAAEVAIQSHISINPGHGLVISSTDSKNRAIDSDADVQEAASHLNFHVTLPAGLPAGTKPVRLFTSGNDLMAVTYDLPGAWRASHHLAWIFLANHAIVGSQEFAHARYAFHPDGRMSTMMWRSGDEEVFVVSNGLTDDEVAAIKQAMTSER